MEVENALALPEQVLHTLGVESCTLYVMKGGGLISVGSGGEMAV